MVIELMERILIRFFDLFVTFGLSMRITFDDSILKFDSLYMTKLCHLLQLCNIQEKFEVHS